MNQISFAKLLLVVSIAAAVLSAIDANPHFVETAPINENFDDLECACPRILIPVCASNGKTYDNWCIFDCAAKKSKTRMEIVKKAACDQDEHLEDEDFPL